MLRSSVMPATHNMLRSSYAVGFVTPRNTLRSCSDEGSRNRNFTLRTGLRNTPPKGGSVLRRGAVCPAPRAKTADATFAWLDEQLVLGSVLGRCRANGCRKSGWQRHRSADGHSRRLVSPSQPSDGPQTTLSARTDHRPVPPFTRQRPGVMLARTGARPVQDGVMGHG